MQRLGLGCNDVVNEGSPAPSAAAVTPQEGTAAPLQNERAEPAQLAAQCEGGHLPGPPKDGCFAEQSRHCASHGGGAHAARRGTGAGPRGGARWQPRGCTRVPLTHPPRGSGGSCAHALQRGLGSGLGRRAGGLSPGLAHAERARAALEGRGRCRGLGQQPPHGPPAQRAERAGQPRRLRQLLRLGAVGRRIAAGRARLDRRARRRGRVRVRRASARPPRRPLCQRLRQRLRQRRQRQGVCDLCATVATGRAWRGAGFGAGGRAAHAEHGAAVRRERRTLMRMRRWAAWRQWALHTWVSAWPHPRARAAEALACACGRRIPR